MITPDLTHTPGQRGYVHREHICALYVGCDIALQGTAARGDGGEVCGANKQLVVVFEEKRPLGRIEFWLGALGLDGIVAVDLRRHDLATREVAA